ncbi:hypothetical protein, partial [Legionella sp.]|uniref:hypothetical protein n=1 Tax=Legionella sp. TaxID=459 RepID=UPI003CA1BC79
GHMFAHREEGLQNQREIQPDLNRSQQSQAEQTVELDTQYQDTLEECIPLLQKKFNVFNKVDGLSAEDKQLIIDSKRLCEEIAPTVRDQVTVSKIELLKTNLDTLMENHRGLKKFTENLDSIISSYSDSLRP